MDKKVKVKYKDIILNKTGQFSGVTAIDLNGCNLLSRGTTTPVGDYQITGVRNGNISYGSSLFDQCNRFTTLDNITYNGLTDADRMFRGTAIDSIPEGIDWSTIKTCQQMFSGAPITGDVELNLPAVTGCNDMFNDTSINSLSFTAGTVNNIYTKPVVSGNTLRHLSLTYPNATAVTNNLTLSALEDYTVNAPVASALTSSIKNINDDATITFNTPQVANIGTLFVGCNRTNLDKVNLPFEQITHAVNAFSGSSITSFTSDLSNLIDGSGMFLNCTALTELDLELPKLTNMGSNNTNVMFGGCSSLKKLRIHTPSLLKGSDLYGCSALTDLTVIAESITGGVPKTGSTTLTALTFNIPSMTGSMALTDSSGYKGLKYSNITSSWSGVPITSSMKLYNSGITTGVMHYAEAKALNGACSGCVDLVSITIDAPKCEGINGIFSGCTSLTNEGITLNTAPILYANNAFYNCTSLTSIPFDCTNLISGNAMVYGSSLSSVTLNMPNATSINNLIGRCSALTQASISAPIATGASVLNGAYPSLTSITLDFPAWTGYTSFSSATNCPVMKNVDETTDWSGNTTSIITRLISSGVTDATFTFPHALGVNNICRDAKALTSVTINAPLATTCTGTFYGCSSLTEANVLHTENIVSANSMFQNCSSLTSFEGDMRNLISIAYMFTNCTKLSHVSMIINELDSAWTQSSFGVHSSAPCQAHRYCFSRNDGNVRLIFTANDYGSSDYQQIDCTDDNRTETLTADTIVMLNEMGSYIADPPEGPAENPHKAIHINILLDGVFVTTTPSRLSRGKFTWSKEPHDGWTQWQDKLWYQHEPMND